MNRIKVRLEDSNPYHSGSAVYLDINDDRMPQLGFNIEDYVRIRGKFNEKAAEFAYFTSIIYGCDRAVQRQIPGGDRWTRELAIEIPVNDPESWSISKNICETMLEFLTGDIWHVDFINISIPLFNRKFWSARRNFRKIRLIAGDTVSLFSGGLDSLIGIINWLDDNPNKKIVLASTYDAQAENARADQERLIGQLKFAYPGRINRFVSRIGLRTDGEDTNFRSRSLAFIGNAVLAASFIGDDTKIIIPENGAIALNYPLTPARDGSLSTRTVHPKFIALVNELLDALGFSHSIENPYEFETKGQMIKGCKNKELLKNMYSESVSCGKRGFDRQYWSNKKARGCGACVPCIFRRAALFAAGLSEELYGYDIGDRLSWNRNIKKANSDLQAVVDFIELGPSPREIWKTLKGNTRLNPNYKNNYISLVQNLKDEVYLWMRYIGIL